VGIWGVVIIVIVIDCDCDFVILFFVKCLWNRTDGSPRVTVQKESHFMRVFAMLAAS
jgi:hypothetical protein